MKFEPLRQRTTPDGVYQQLRDAILGGDLTPGQQLREAHIAAEMGCSRAPLREAFTRLEEDGLITRVPFRGAFVTEVSAETMAEIASLRFLVEPYAAERSAAVLRTTQRKALDSSVSRLHRATKKRDTSEAIDAHLSFHRLLYEFADHQQLWSLWNGWESQLRLFLAVDHASYSNLEDIATAHQDLADMIIAGDMDRFRRALAHHVHSAPGAPIEDDAHAPHAAHEASCDT